ncbi:MAG: hypothetical protein COA57_13315 [Flavobacteriales bacterium]|nr:MAG: hypothetical protein COA57_13315 [Flavobacteriales bacterium]
MKQFVIIATAITINFYVYAQETWVWQQPVPQGNAIHSLAFFNSSKAVGVGQYGAMIKTSDGGNSWWELQSGIYTDLNDVHFTDAMNWFAVGNSGIMLNSTDGGETWQIISSGTQINLKKIRFYDHRLWVCWDCRLVNKAS